MWMRTMQKAEEAGNDMNRRRMTKLEECGLSGKWRSLKMKKWCASAANTARWKKAAAASTGHKSVKTNATDSVEMVRTDVTDSGKFVQITVMDVVTTTMGSAEAMQTGATDAVKLVRIGVMDSVFYPRRKTCKCQAKADEMKSASWNNPFFALTAIESEDDEEVNAVEAVQEIVEITVDSGAAKSVWPSRKKVVERTKSTRTVKLAAENGSPIRVEGDARLEFVRDGKKCSMRFLDADVKRLLASVSAVVDDGNVVVFGQHELFIESVSTGQRIPMCRRNGVIVMRLGAQPCSKAAGYVGIGERNTNERMPVFRRPA